MIKMKNKMVTMLLAMCMIFTLFAGIAFSLPQKTTTVYAAVYSYTYSSTEKEWSSNMEDESFNKGDTVSFSNSSTKSKSSKIYVNYQDGDLPEAELYNGSSSYWEHTFDYDGGSVSLIGRDVYITDEGQETQYNIAYLGNGGSWEELPIDYNNYSVNDEIYLQDYDGTKDGYSFVGWNTDEDATTGSLGSYTIAAKDIPESGDVIWFFAIWTPTTYNITYNLDNGTNSNNNPATYTIETETLTLADPTKSGYTFGGWYSDSKFTTGNEVTIIAKGSTGEKTLYAKWTQSSGGSSDANTGIYFSSTDLYIIGSVTIISIIVLSVLLIKRKKTY